MANNFMYLSNCIIFLFIEFDSDPTQLENLVPCNSQYPNKGLGPSIKIFVLVKT